jgi:hypothetical protein
VVDTVGAVLDSLAQPKVQAGVRKALAQNNVPKGDAQRLRALNQEESKHRNRIKRARDSFFDGTMTREEYDAYIKEENEAIAAIIEERNSLSESVREAEALPPVDEVLANLGPWSQEFREGTTANQREVLKVLVKTVTPRVIKPGKGGTWTADIEWTPLGEKLRQATATSTAP